ncbi:MAG: Ldh family oxidoreductase [Streptosporangiales bacterium]
MAGQEAKSAGRFLASGADLTRFAEDVFVHAGMRQPDAVLTARSLVDADASGIPTHGVNRLAPYVAQLESGQVNPRPDERDVTEGPAFLLVDADRGFGAPVGIRTVDRIVQKARTAGVAIAGVTSVAHFGAAGFYTRHAADRGCLAFAVSSTSPSVVPFGGRGPRIGNSPISFASPGSEHPELVLDMAQSMSSRGRIRLALDADESIPEDWAVDEDGHPTRDPAAALAGGVLASGGHKGSALSLMVEMLASGLTGANLTRNIALSGLTGAQGNAGKADLDVTVGNFYLAIDAGVFDDAPEVRRRATAIADHVRASEPAPDVDGVHAPGDVEEQARERSQRSGIPLREVVLADLGKLAERFGVPMPAVTESSGEHEQ